MLTKDADAQRRGEFDIETLQALHQRQLPLLLFSAARLLGEIAGIALPGKEPDQRQHQRADNGKYQAGVEKGERIIFAQRAD